MDIEYILFVGVCLVGFFLVVLAAYLIFRRSIAMLMAVIVAACVVIGGILAFILGKEGLSPVGAVVVVAVGVPIVVSLMSILVRQVVTPTKQMAATAMSIARGNVNQQVSITRRDEIGDLANAFRGMIAYLQGMASAADLLAQGDLTAEVTPRSEKDRLGNAFHQMIVSLNDTLRQTDNVVEQVVPSVEQMRAISQSLASSAEEQSSAAEEISSSLEETDAQVKGNAESASLANQLVSQATDVANAG